MRSRRRSTPSTARPPATRSPPACSSRCSRGSSRRRRCAAPAPPARSPPRASARSLPCRRPRRSTDTPAVTTPVILDCDPGHDDAIALLLALASPEIELVGVTTMHGNQTLDKTTDNALRRARARRPRPTCRSPSAPSGRSCASSTSPPTSTARAASTGPSCRPRASEPVEQNAVDFLVEHVTPETVLVPVGPLTNVALALDRGIRPGADRADGRRDRRGEHDPGGRVQHLGRSRGRAARLPLRARRDDDRARRHARRAPDAGVGRPVPRGRPRRHVRRRAGRVLQAVPRADVRLGRGADPRRRRARARRSGPGSSRPSG